MIEFIHRFRNSLRRYVPTGARLIAPMSMGAALIAIVIATLWFGGKRESLAAYAESTFLRFALKYSTVQATNPDKVVVISAKDTDYQAIQHTANAMIRDASIEEYASIVEQVAIHDPSMIIVSWLASAHPLTAAYLKPLTDTIDRLGINERTIIAIHLYTAGAVPEELQRKYQIAEARDCYYEVNLFCTWRPDWTWMPQRVASAFFKDQPKWVISTNLPHVLPNFILNLPTTSSLTTYSFLDFRPPVTAEIAKGAAVFIGNDITQELHFRENKDLLQRTFIASSPNHKTLQTDGIPFHVFWAAMAQMFIDHRTIAVVPELACNLALIFMCVGILIAIRAVGGKALGPFLICALSLPLANLIGVRYFAVYMPVVPLIIAGFAMFIAAAFTLVAYNSYRGSKLHAMLLAAESTTDIKQNFISLISHNLNTPVAQLRGLLDVLSQTSHGSSPELTRAAVLLEYIRVIVRVVLNTSALAGQSRQFNDVTTRKFWNEFIETEGSLLNRLGIKSSVTPDENDDELGEIWFYRFTIDQAVAAQALLVTMVFALGKYHVDTLQLHFAAVRSEPGNPEGLVIRLSWQEHSSEEAREIPNDFLNAALLRYLEVVAEFRGITSQFDSTGVVLTVPDKPLHPTT